MSIFTHLIDTVKKNGAAYVVLIDPDKNDENSIQDRVLKANESGVDALFVGGSLMMDTKCVERVKLIKSCSNIPNLTCNIQPKIPVPGISCHYRLKHKRIRKNTKPLGPIGPGNLGPGPGYHVCTIRAMHCGCCRQKAPRSRMSSVHSGVQARS